SRAYQCVGTLDERTTESLKRQFEDVMRCLSIQENVLYQIIYNQQHHTLTLMTRPPSGCYQYSPLHWCPSGCYSTGTGNRYFNTSSDLIADRLGDHCWSLGLLQQIADAAS